MIGSAYPQHPSMLPARTRRCLLLVALLSLALIATQVERAVSSARTYEDRYSIDSTLHLLQSLRVREDVPPRLQRVVKSDKLLVSVRFRTSSLSSVPSLERIEKETGVTFSRTDGKIAPVGNVCGAEASWESLDRLTRWPGVERIDSMWKPAVASPVDVSVHAIRADDVWELLDAGGWPVTGRGIVIAVFDTGVDVFHPDLWRVGGTYPWVDVNGNGRFDPGTDAVDVNRNGQGENSERLDVLDSGTAFWSDPIQRTNDGAFQSSMDWLYNDANNNLLRDGGQMSGFGESDPSYGERLFLVDDRDHDELLGVGEVLVALDTSKVQRTLRFTELGVEERRRGQDLIANAPDLDSWGHGTQVCSILCGGSAGLHRYVGVAPDSQLLVARRYDANGNNRYGTYIPWAEDAGADVMLYPFGSWIQEFLDGSSNLEQMMDAEAAKGIVQVVPVGNLASGQKHAHVTLASSQTRDSQVQVPAGQGRTELWLSVLWQAPEDALSLELRLPGGASVPLPGDDSWLPVAGHNVWSYRERSPRDMSRFDVLVDRGGKALAEGNWTLRLRNNTSAWLDVHAYLSDDLGEWAEGITFLDNIDTMFTLTSPATADSAIAVASYSTRGRLVGTPGGLSPFSGQGPRVGNNPANDPAVDIAAPGHYDITCASSKDVPGSSTGQYAWFGGTSAAASHVAGAVALLLQSEPYLSPPQIAHRLCGHARNDTFTGIVPNSRWGCGKLDIGAALGAPVKPSPTPRARVLLPIILRPVRPQS